jgi:hypothetical protein
LELKNGGMEVMLRMDRVSNSGWSEVSPSLAHPCCTFPLQRSQEEFDCLVEICAAERVALPTRKEINDLCTEKQKLMSRDITEVGASRTFRAPS